jgi:hypothetical protein
MREEAPVLERGNVRFSKDLLAEVDRGHPVIRIPKEHVQAIALRRGFKAARPAVQAALGLVLFGGCLYLLLGALLGLHGLESKLAGRILIGLVIFAVVGAWLLWGAFKRGYYLEVMALNRKEKLCFDPKLSEPEIRDFLKTVRRSALGYSIAPESPLG